MDHGPRRRVASTVVLPDPFAGEGTRGGERLDGRSPRRRRVVHAAVDRGREPADRSHTVRSRGHSHMERTAQERDSGRRRKRSAARGGRMGTSWRGPWFDHPRHGPLPALLLVLTVATGVVDAVSILALGRVFIANMTGNVVFIGF